MRYRKIETAIDFNDPEEGFRISGSTQAVEVAFRDWRNREITVRFEAVYKFSLTAETPYAGLPEASFLELLDEHTVGPPDTSQPILHCLLSTNEGEWCEVVCEGFVLTIG